MLSLEDRITDSDGTCSHKKYEEDTRNLTEACLTGTPLRGLFADFDFEHPYAFAVNEALSISYNHKDRLT